MKKKFFFFYFLVLNLIIFSLGAKETNLSGLTTCDFKVTKNNLKEYNDTKIRSIDIKVDDYRKWSKNNIKIITSPGRYILEKYKKRFKAKLTVFFEDDTKCVFSSKIRQSGDEKDHIGLYQNSIIQSLDIQLIDGNIKGITTFKIYKPETRGNHTDEIIQTQLLRNFGYLAPRTMNVKIDINGNKSEMLLQEKAAKELLEHNNRREGPILEGDEKFFWKVVRDIPDNNKSNWDMGLPFLLNKSSKAMLPKSTNSKLILRSNEHMKMFFRALDNLNLVYLNWGNTFQNEKNKFFFSDYDLDNFLLSMQNEEFIQKLEIYNLLMQATNSQHGLAVPNRKFYWNSINNYFEPINYDSNPNIDVEFSNTTNNLPRLPVTKNYLKSINTLFVKLKNINYDQLLTQLNASGLSINNFELEKKINKVILNLEKVKEKYLTLIDDDLISYNSYKKSENLYSNFFDALKEINPDTYIIKNIDVDDNNFYRCKIYFEDCSEFKLKNTDIVKLFEGGLSIKGKKYQYVANNLDLKKNKYIKKYNLKTFNDTKIYYENEIDISIDENNNKINLTQNKAGAKIYFINGTLKNVKINYKGVQVNNNINDLKILNDTAYFPMNSEGLTGCLSLINLNLENISLSSNVSSCEDAINIINSTGFINEIKIVNSHSDALDVDFSNLTINKIEISNAGNDCSDFSAGNYTLKFMLLKNCIDKGVSVGEKSNVNINELDVSGAQIGIASKDSSITQIDKINSTSTNICVSSYNKKQEFFGSIVNIKKINCNNYKKFTEFDKLSKIVISK